MICRFCNNRVKSDESKAEQDLDLHAHCLVNAIHQDYLRLDMDGENCTPLLAAVLDRNNR